MYVKIQSDSNIFYENNIFETDSLGWRFLVTKKEAEEALLRAEVGDYGLYDRSDDIKLALILEDKTILLDSGVVYIMNEYGKTIDTISV